MNRLPQRHPQEKTDRLIIDALLKSDSSDSMALVELARLRIRYQGFPGAPQTHIDLDLLLDQWHLTENELFVKTREIHSGKPIYKVKAKKYEEPEDWR